MPLYSYKIVLNKNNPNLVVTDYFAPFELTIDPSSISLNKNIRKIEYVWADDDIEIVNYKPNITNIANGNPKKTQKVKKFFSNDSNLSVYIIKINVYSFGSETPFVFTITLNLKNPVIDQIPDVSYFNEVHLVKTKMFGSDNKILYVFETKDENNLLMSLVDWKLRPIIMPPPPPRLPRPYVFLEPFATRYNDPNTNIKNIPYSYNNNPNSIYYNPDSLIPLIRDYNTSTIRDEIFATLTSNVDLRINGKDPVLAQPIFSTQNDNDSIYVRNTDCWAYELDLTCNSVWNSSTTVPGGRRGSGTLITKRHIIFSALYEIPEGSTIRFVTKDNVVIERTMLYKKRHPSYSTSTHYYDICVGVLDSDVPNTIKPCKILPENFLGFLPQNINNIPVLFINQNRNADIFDGDFIETTLTHYTAPTNDNNSSIRHQYYEQAVDGDNGTPQFFVFRNDLILLSVCTFSGTNAAAGTTLLYQKDAINKLIRDLDIKTTRLTGYKIEPVNMDYYFSY